MSADIPMKIMFETKPSVHLTVYRGNIHNWRYSGEPEYAKNEEQFSSFLLYMVMYLRAIK